MKKFLTTIIIALGLVFWYRDPNFRAEIKMNHAMERLEWRKALDNTLNSL